MLAGRVCSRYLRAVTDFPLQGQRDTFRAAAIAFVPELATAEPSTWDTLEAIVARGLADRSPGVLRQLRLFLRVIALISRARHGRGLSRLEPEARAALLHRLERAPLLLIRRGVWGLRTLVFMGYYRSPR